MPIRNAGKNMLPTSAEIKVAVGHVGEKNSSAKTSPDFNALSSEGTLAAQFAQSFNFF